MQIISTGGQADDAASGYFGGPMPKPREVFSSVHRASRQQRWPNPSQVPLAVHCAHHIDSNRKLSGYPDQRASRVLGNCVVG
jgi:predicted neuraminidase